MAERLKNAVHMLRSGDSAKNILRKLYDGVDGKHVVKLRHCVRELTCLAAHYDNGELLLALLSDCVFREKSPLLAASYNRCLKTVKLLVNLKYFRSDERTRGIVKCDKVTREEQSPMEIAMENDDPDLMVLLEAVYQSKCIPLAHLALQYNAHKCFEALEQAGHASLGVDVVDCVNRDLLLTAASSELGLLQRVLDSGIGDIGRITAVKGQTAVHLAMKPSTKGVCPGCSYPGAVQPSFIPKDLPHKLRLLLQNGADVNKADCDEKLPLDVLTFQPGQQLSGHAPEHCLDGHSRTVLLACEEILNHMTPAENSASVVPRRTVELLYIHQRMICHRIDHDVYVLGSEKSALTLIQNMFKLFLRMGMDLQARLQDRGTVLDVFLAGFKHAIPPAAAIPFLHDHVRSLLINGARLTDMSFPILDRFHRWQWQSQNVTKLSREITYICASMMPQEQFQAYRTWLEKQRNEGQQLPCLPGVQQLQEMCRVKLYDAVPHRIMAAYMDKLNPPYLMRRYLTLWA